MASRQATVDDILAAIGGAGTATARKMFGEYCIYLDAKPVAVVCDDRFFVKATDAGRTALPGLEEASPYPGAKPHLVVPPAVLADRDAVTRLMRATFAAVPRPKPRKPRGGAA